MIIRPRRNSATVSHYFTLNYKDTTSSLTWENVEDPCPNCQYLKSLYGGGPRNFLRDIEQAGGRGTTLMGQLRTLSEPLLKNVWERVRSRLMGRVVSGSYEIRDIDAVLDDVDLGLPTNNSPAGPIILSRSSRLIEWSLKGSSTLP